ncbi:nucleoid-associated protein [Methylobacter sp.]|uniref:nucleoid-associated protein n=1 Tax=Methylobacter sp. TaxID=2051955 RepID=UPI002FDDCA23
MITVHYAVIHELIKTAGTTVASVNPASTLLPATDEIVVKLISELDKLYGTKENTAVYGTFSRKDSTNQFAQYTDSFVDNKIESTFFGFSKQGADEIARESKGQQSATGGYLVFADYSNSSGQEFLLITMIKNKGAIRINEQLKLEDIIEIDLSKIHQAARINLDRFQKSKQPISALISEDDVTLNYLSFVSPRSNHEVSGYFIRGMDCVNGVSPTIATNNAFKCAKTYCKSKDELKQLSAKVNDSLVEYFQSCLDSEKTATLAGIEHSIRKVVPADNHILLNDFIEFASSEDWQIPAEFNVSKSGLSKYTRIRSKTDNWEINFKKNAVGTKDSSDLFYDKNTGKLTIRCSDDLIKQITEVLETRSDVP